MTAHASPAGRAEASVPDTRPWRWVYALGAGVAVVLLALYAGLPDPPGGRGPGPPVGAYFSAMIGYYLAVGALLARGGVLDAMRLQTLPGSRRAALAREMVRPSWRWLLGFTMVAVALHLAIVTLADVDYGLLGDPDVRASRLGLTLVLGWLHVPFIAAYLSLLFTQASALQRAARELPQVDLVDHAELAPFVRHALRLALVAAVGGALTAGFHVDWEAGSAAPQLVLVLPVTVLVVVGVFLLPLWGTHVRLREGRNAELQRIHAALRGEPGALDRSVLLREGETLGTVELLAYREHVRAIGTWPVDASALSRLALYLGIPLVGWIGGALVERLLDALLD